MNVHILALLPHIFSIDKFSKIRVMISYITLPKTENLDCIMHINFPLFYLNHSHSYLLRNYAFLYAFYNMKQNSLFC